MDKIKVKGRIDFKIYARLDTWYKRLALKFFQQFHYGWDILFLNKYGTLKDSWSVDNLIVNLGKAAIAGLVGNTGSQTAFSYIEVGTSNTAVAATQTALQAAITTNGLQRASATVSRTTTNVANDTLNLAKTFTVTGSSTVEEIGVFNAASSGVMLGRALTTTKSLSNGDSFITSYSIIFT